MLVKNEIFLKDDVILKLSYLDESRVKFTLSLGMNYVITDTANLIRIENLKGQRVIPEGTNRIDYNNIDDLIGYKCDSTFTYFNDSVDITFALENLTHKRLDLQLELIGTKTSTKINKTLLKN
jgi:hypothetical protein